jgi:hypothetical protein
MIMKAIAIAAMAAICLLAGCSTAQQQDLSTLAANAKVQVSKACMLVQPTLLDLNASMPGNLELQTLTADNAKVCAAVAALDPTNVQSLINTVIPEAIGLVSLLPMDPAKQDAIKLALGAASIALSNWMIVYGQQAPAPASAPLTASA